MITNTFPTIGDTNGNQIIHTLNDSPPANDSNASRLATEYNYPRRQIPPSPPTKLPFPANENNRETLRQYLLNHFQSRTFNTCEYQPLPMMEGPPLQLMVDPSATPVAIHTPVPVPIHWRDDIKAGLDRDVRLGVIESVPVWRTGEMVPSHGRLCQEKWQTEAHR